MSGGHVRQRGKSWSYVLDGGPDPASGHRRQVWKGGFRTKREAQVALREALSQIDHGTLVTQQRTTVADYLDQWLETMPPNVRATPTLAFLEFSQAHRLHAAFVLLATTGMRRGRQQDRDRREEAAAVLRVSRTATYFTDLSHYAETDVEG